MVLHGRFTSGSWYMREKTRWIVPVRSSTTGVGSQRLELEAAGQASDGSSTSCSSDQLRPKSRLVLKTNGL